MGLLNIVGRLSLDAKPFQATLSGISGAVGKFTSSLTGMVAGVFSAVGIINYTKRMVELGAQIADTSTKLGISAEAFQELSFAAKTSGADVANVEQAFRGLSAARLEALQNPGKEHSLVFSAFGISAKELKESRLEDIFRKIGDAVRTTDFGASEIAMVNKLLGRSGQELIPMFRDGIQKLSQDARDLGLIIDNSVVAGLKRMNDNLDILGVKSAEVFTRMTAQAVEAANMIAEANLRQMRKGKFSIFDLFSGKKQGQAFAQMAVEDFAKAIGGSIQKQIVGPALKAVFGGAGGERVKKDFLFPEAAKQENKERIKQERISPLSDSLRAVGNFLGSGPARGIAGQLSSIDKKLDDIKTNTARQAEGADWPP